ncbi:alpha-D-ribose 1-methylphosphonate 5-triphosphate synthase subunit PhnH [Pararhizobium capsulatum DSM 1112]|uniref:Alpha-D-ribose 1-methylphosphonate 5-triphosphate synthase subunit PhnH n=1 Tax=Pararhizobium capsulatum DSM 1112 TaxID=1121113 RepID=A0ABU0BJN6_9HYPH|nr:phosphonate C-P lyase system protein PhnH [Pararhizobium capsulatum]MDQ0318098.1 alpha-D-ribose 1-methylphosphonate 5-triphosphate synthase subunit PhnH [Pararhizobium capsulatum DSM 1112]
MRVNADKNGAAYRGGFADPVFQAQGIFRAVMDAMARPCTVQSLSGIIAAVKPPAPLSAGAGAIALTLCDADTPVWLSPALRQSAAKAWLAFHAGAPFTETKTDARFAFVEAGGLVPGFGHFSLGTQEYPDRSATLALEVDALTGGPVFRAMGPGIKEEAVFAAAGLPDVFDILWAENHALFPRGVDLILVTGSELLCLPRTTKLERREA